MNMEEFKKTFEKLKDNPMYQSYCSMLETKDKVIKRLVKENNQLKEQLKTKHDGVMASIEQNCEYATILIKLRSWLEKLGNCDIYTSEILSKLNELEGGKNEK